MNLRTKSLSTSVLLLSSVIAQVAEAQDSVIIPATVPFSKTVNVSKAVKNECELGNKVSAYIDQYSSGVKLQDSLGQGKRIEMEITEVHAPGGGAWSGAKWVEVTGTMKDGNKSVASFRAKRISGGGAFSSFKGTCKILARCTKALGRDIANWIKDPVDDAKLGDAR